MSETLNRPAPDVGAEQRERPETQEGELALSRLYGFAMACAGNPAIEKALGWAIPTDADVDAWLADVLAALRSAPAQQPSEPVAWADPNDLEALRVASESAESAVRVPVWWRHEGTLIAERYTVPLYRSPASPEARDAGAEHTHAWLRRMGDAEDAVGGAISVGGFVVDAGLYSWRAEVEGQPGAADLMRDLAAAMERVRGCDEKQGEDGLCDCARFIGFIIRERTRHVSAMRQVIEEMEAELAALRHSPAGADAESAAWLIEGDGVRHASVTEPMPGSPAAAFRVTPLYRSPDAEPRTLPEGHYEGEVVMQSQMAGNSDDYDPSVLTVTVAMRLPLPHPDLTGLSAVLTVHNHRGNCQRIDGYVDRDFVKWEKRVPADGIPFHRAVANPRAGWLPATLVLRSPVASVPSSAPAGPQEEMPE